MLTTLINYLNNKSSLNYYYNYTKFKESKANNKENIF